MPKVKLFSVGKTKELWLEQALNEYIKRLKATCSIECIWAKNDDQLLAVVKSEPYVLCLDSTGTEYTSEEFAEFFFKALEASGARLSIVIGGPEGLPASLKKDAHLISLSKLTFTHQVARLILLEQIYRAVEIMKGSKYHK